MDTMGGLHKSHGKPLVMDGPEVAAMVLSRVPPLVRETLDFAFCNGLPTPAAFAMHQANAFLLEQLARKLRLREVYGDGCLPSNIARYGNCSSASIPLLLCDTDAWRDADRHGSVVMVGFGAGWSAGAAVADLRETSVLLLAEEA
jgi:3-oxoacyl-[acyl-carrier-protein] synthase-3